MLKGDPRGGRVRQYGDISILWEGRILELVQLAPGSRYGRRDYLELLRPVRKGGGGGEMSTNGGIFAEDFPCCQNASRPSLLASPGMGRLDPSSREASRPSRRKEIRCEKGRKGGEKRREKQLSLPGTGGILRDSWRRYNFSSFPEILSFSTISSRHIPFRQCQ